MEEKAEREMDRTIECAAFEVSCSEGEIYTKLFGDMGVF